MDWLNLIKDQRWFLQKENPNIKIEEADTLLLAETETPSALYLQKLKVIALEANQVIAYYSLPICSGQIAFAHPDFAKKLKAQLGLNETPVPLELESSNPCFATSREFIKFYAEQRVHSRRAIREKEQSFALIPSGCSPALKAVWEEVAFLDNSIQALCWERVKGPNLWEYLCEHPEALDKVWPLCIDHLVKLHSYLPQSEDLMEFAPDHPLFAGITLKWRAFQAHGDYHFGQILYTDNGLKSVDWEGEPIANPHWPLAITNPFADLAGLFRSLDYFSQTQQLNLDLQSLWNSAWEMYFRGLKRDPSPQEKIQMAWAVVARNLYELDYERKSRPHMVDIPLRGQIESESFAKSLLKED